MLASINRLVGNISRFLIPTRLSGTKIASGINKIVQSGANENRPYHENFSAINPPPRRAAAILRMPIDQEQSYYDGQVRALTRSKNVPKGTQGLRNHLKNAKKDFLQSAGSHHTFVYLAEKDPPKNIFTHIKEWFMGINSKKELLFDNNHFVTINISKTKNGYNVDYLDPQGNAIRRKDRNVIANLFPDSNIYYRSNNYSRLSDFKARQHDLKGQNYRLTNQYDKTSCGAYATEFFRIYDVADKLSVAIAATSDKIVSISDKREELIRKGLEQLSGRTAQEIRNSHTEYLGLPRSRPKNSQTTKVLLPNYALSRLTRSFKVAPANTQEPANSHRNALKQQAANQAQARGRA